MNGPDRLVEHEPNLDFTQREAHSDATDHGETHRAGRFERGVTKRVRDPGVERARVGAERDEVDVETEERIEMVAEPEAGLNAQIILQIGGVSPARARREPQLHFASTRSEGH